MGRRHWITQHSVPKTKNPRRLIKLHKIGNLKEAGRVYKVNQHFPISVNEPKSDAKFICEQKQSRFNLQTTQTHHNCMRALLKFVQ
jgi:hypothetical protein